MEGDENLQRRQGGHDPGRCQGEGGQARGEADDLPEPEGGEGGGRQKRQPQEREASEEDGEGFETMVVFVPLSQEGDAYLLVGHTAATEDEEQGDEDRGDRQRLHRPSAVP